ncbi:hypothetical protein TSAR_015931 [Trichomalopsis sarcophagae]|uniref:WAP domain-containing protein n=1 Tax=Trichomalopsis sarcophagae TaxID=543379 RepID=A0A232F0B2_9HYME|nr:hypothetical protein TSAR_015931 [Trichomalopsis sarcophagae]
MDSRACLVFLLLQLCILGFGCVGCAEATIGRHHHDSNAIPSAAQAAEKEHKLLIECQNSDYRTYIKCLKREKRQQSHPSGNMRCLDECLSLDYNCTTPTCIRDCHSHCKKRYIETYSKTVETSYDCTDDTCTENKVSKTPNITNIININHVQANCTNSNDTNPKIGGREVSKSNETSSSDSVMPRIDIHNQIINNPSQNCGCHLIVRDNSIAGCNCNSIYNQWQPMPQITIGFGGGPTGGCMFTTAWPCFPRYPTPQIDCSICINPFLRYRCDPGCYPDPNAINRRDSNAFNATAQSDNQTRKWHLEKYFDLTISTQSSATAEPLSEKVLAK